MTLSATEAAFEGFRLVRRHPMALIFWSLAYLVAFGVFFGVFGSNFATLMAASESMEGTNPSMADLEGLGQTYLGMFSLLAPLMLVLGAVLNAAVARAVVRPQEKSFGYMRLGGDELRVLVVSIALTIVIAAASVVLFTVVGLAAGFAAQVNAGLAVLVGVLLGLGAIAVTIWLLVRLSLAVPITVAKRRISVFDSFGLTKGHTFSLLGMGIIAFIMSTLVAMLSGVVALPVTMMTGDINQLAALDGASTMEILRTAGPAITVFVVVNAIASALQLAVLYAPFSAAYLDLKGLPHEA